MRPGLGLGLQNTVIHVSRLSQKVRHIRGPDRTTVHKTHGLFHVSAQLSRHYVLARHSLPPSMAKWSVSILHDNRFEERPPFLRAVDVPLAQQGALHVAVLIEAEQGMVAGAVEMPVIGGAFLWTTTPEISSCSTVAFVSCAIRSAVALQTESVLVRVAFHSAVLVG